MVKLSQTENWGGNDVSQSISLFGVTQLVAGDLDPSLIVFDIPG